MADVLELPASPESPARARRFVTERLQRWGYDAAVADAQLVVSELATNAVLHAREPFTVAIEDCRGKVRVEVHDPTSGTPAPREAETDAEDGRGLAIVEKLGLAWGVESIPNDGKVVWCELAG